MGRHIVVALRMPPAGVTQGAEGAYLPRARSMCARGEALGGRLIAWSAALLAMAWDSDSMEEAILLATGLSEGALSPQHAWSCGIAEGELEALAPDGQRMHLAWGDALLAAAGLARVSRPGEVLVDGGVEALKAGQLALTGARSSTDAGRRVRGWRLDLERPWKVSSAAPWPVMAPAEQLPVKLAPAAISVAPVGFVEEVSTDQVLELVAAVPPPQRPTEPQAAVPADRGATLADRVRAISRSDSSHELVALAGLRQARAQAEGGAAAARCQAALAIAVALSLLGRAGEALLDALDALGCARESGDPKAVGACVVLIARLYASAGYADAASKLSKLVEEPA